MGCHSGASSAAKVASGGATTTATNTSKTINSVSEAKDLQSLADFMQDKYGIQVNTQSFQNIDFESAKIAAEGVAMIMDEFPGAQSVFTGFEATVSRSNAFASASYGGRININPDKFKTVDGINTSYDRTTASLFHPAGTKAVHITSHEAGHVLERALIEKSFPGTDFWSQIGRSQAWDKSQCASKVISEAARQAKKTAAGKGKKIDTLISEVSGYAKKNRSETLAECVADYAANGSKAKVLSQEVWKVLKRELG